MSDTIDCWKPWLALADEAPRPIRKNLGSSLFLGSRVGGDGREIFQGDGHGNQLVAVAINKDVAGRLVGGCIIDRETIQILLDLLNPLHGEIDRQTYEQKVSENFDAPADAEYNVDITAQMDRDLTQAVMILENRLRDPQLTEQGVAALAK